MLQLGIIGTSKKTDERRRPIHPDHLARLPAEIRARLVFETGYGEAFGVSDAELRGQCGGLASRVELLSELGNVVLPKPVLGDL